MATIALGSKTVGSIVKLKENGSLVDYLVVHQGRPSTSVYDASCDGTWLLRKDIAETRKWHSSSVNNLENSDIHKYLNGDWLNRYEAAIKSAIKTVKIPYRKGGGSGGTTQTGANGLSCQVFLLSGYEMGWTTSDNQYFPVDGAKLAYFDSGTSTAANNKRIANFNNSATNWWLRSLRTYNTNYVWRVNSNGYYYSNDAANTYGVRPALILPSNLLVSDDGSVSTNTAPTTPASINVPSTINGGDTITVSWSASSDAEGNLVGYELDRSTDGGTSWVNIYKSSATSTTNIVAFGTKTVKYRVRAYDSENLYSAYKESAEVTVVNNNAPTAPSSITVPNTVTGGATLTVTWGAASDVDGNLAGYSLERQVDGGGWSVIYTGNTLSYVDTITKGWAKVCYRVRAYDSYNAYSGYTTSPERTVNNNTAPTITCDSPSGSDLGKKTAGFEVDYSVDDVDSDTVTVTEAIDGVTKRTFQATLKQNYSFQITGETFMKLLNGSHTATITANDGKVSTVHNLTFSKEVTRATITLKEPMDADDKISICVMSVVGFIPSDAEYRVEVTNNANDDEPVWEDCTTEVKSGANHIFSNQEAEKGFAFNFRVTAERGSSGVGGYITSVQGGFQ